MFVNMRDLTVEIPGGVVGYTGAETGPAVFHKVKSQDDEGFGVSPCGATLSDIRDKREIRRYERPCSLCWRGTPTTSPTVRRTANIRPPLVPAVSPVGPLDLRVTTDGKLGIKSADGQWLVFDPQRPVLLETADDQAAEGWRTLRTTWPTETLINGIEIADRFDVDRALITKWRRDALFPAVSGTVGDRPGWYRELWPAIEQWVAARSPERGRAPKQKQ